MNIMQDIELHYRIEQFYTHYASLLDEAALEKWLDLFCEDSSYALIARDNFEQGLPLSVIYCENHAMLRDRVYAIQKALVYEPRYFRHHITNLKISKKAEHLIEATANYTVIETVEGELPRILNSGKYIDKIKEDKGKYFFLDKCCVYDTILIPNSIIYPV